MMRLKYAKLVTIFVFLVNVILLYYTWKWFLFGEQQENSTATAIKLLNDKSKQKDRIQSTNKHIKKTITIIFRDFYHFENDLQHSIDSILNLVPNIQILVIYEDEPYPPLHFISNYTATRTNVKFINLNFDIRKSAKALSPIYQVRTKYVLFVPDSFRFGGRAIIQKMVKEIEKEPTKILTTLSSSVAASASPSIEQNNRMSQIDQKKVHDDITTNEKNIKTNGKATIKKIVILPFASNVKTMGNCCRIKLDFVNWTMEYSVKNDTNDCDMVNSIELFELIRKYIIIDFLCFLSLLVLAKACYTSRYKSITSNAKSISCPLSRNGFHSSKNS